MTTRANRNVLLIAFHFPPFATSSGVQRTLSFSLNLRAHGWIPTVLTVRPDVFERTSGAQLDDIPTGSTVVRTRAFDAARHLAVRGRYWSRLALPDRWVSWWFTAVPAGLRLIRRESIDAVWSTYPIATAHLIGATLSRLSGRPWIADFRDPMVEQIPSTGEWFPKDPALRAARLRAEARAVSSASSLVFCTEAARAIVTQRFEGFRTTQSVVIPNGFEERAFAVLRPRAASATPHRFVLLHSGIIYPGPDRDPRHVLLAVRALADAGTIMPGQFELRFRDPSNEAALAALIRDIGVHEFTSIQPQLAYRTALQEMIDADALLILQGESSNAAIPAKLYEYLRAGRPILACVHPAGETARTLRELQIDSVAPLTDTRAITEQLGRCLRNVSEMESALPSLEVVSRFARERHAQALAAVLDRACDSGAAL